MASLPIGFDTAPQSVQPQTGHPTASNAISPLTGQLGEVALENLCDPTSPFFDAIACIDGGGTINAPSSGLTNTTEGGSSASATAIATAAVNLSIVNNIGDQLANTISDAIAEAADQASVIAENTANTITQSVSSITTGMGSAINAAFGGIADFFKGLLSSLASGVGQLLQTLASNIGDIVSKVASAVSSAIVPIAQAVSNAVNTFNQINQQYIIPLTQYVQQTVQTINGLVNAIQTDLHNGVQGILQLPNDINTGITNLEAGYQRVMQQLGISLDSTVNVHLGGSAGDTIWTRLQSLGSNITQLNGAQNLTTTYKDTVKLPEPNIVQAGAASVDAMWAEISTVIGAIMHGGKDALDGLKTGLPVLSTILGLTGEFPAMIVALAGASFAACYPFFTFVKNDMQAKTGLSKLEPNAALQGWLRGFIDTQTLQQELAVQGWDAQRVQVMTDLTNYLLPIEQIIDMQFRGIVTTDDVAANAKQHGIQPVDLLALQAAAVKLFPVDIALTAYRWQIINEDALNAVLAENRYTADQISAVKATLYQHEPIEEAMLRLRRQQYWAESNFSPNAASSVPQDVSDAGRRDGLAADYTLDKWQDQFYVPPVDTIIELYFRGYRTLNEVTAVMNYWMVPEQLRDDLIKARQSLIPWRTIPTMLANNVISEAYAKQQLQAHGFDLSATEALLKYAAVAHASKRAQVSGDPLQASVSAAHELWTIGAFTDEQYEETLTAHGFTKDQAAQIVASQKNHASVQERKQLATDITNEVLAGLITVDQAKQQMLTYQFTIAESAKVLKTIARTQKAVSKLPSVAELIKFTKARAITFARFKEVMALLGYSPEWINAYAVLDLPPDITGGLILPTSQAIG